MQVHDAGEMASRAESLGSNARITQLHPLGPTEDAMLAVDLLEIDPDGSTPLGAHHEEHVYFVLAGTGEIRGAVPVGAAAGSAITLHPGSVVHVGHREVHSVVNTGREVLRVLVSTPLIVRSERALRIDGHRTGASAAMQLPAEARPVAPEAGAPNRAAGEYPGPAGMERGRETRGVAEPPPEEPEEPVPDITGLVKKASEVPAAPRTERRRPQPPEPEHEPTAPQDQDGEARQAEEDGAAGNVMELQVVFDGGSRGNPGPGYGSFMVQSPNRKPYIKRLEFGDNYTNNQAEYDSLIECLKYIIKRLEATNRSPEQVQLDIKSDSDLVVNQLLGVYKVKDAGLKARHAQAVELLDRFAAWMINWQPRTETVRLLGH